MTNYSWTKISALPRNGHLAEALQARIADPLWMLSRQRQFGALKGEMAGSPVTLEIRHRSVPVDQMRNGRGRFLDLPDQDMPIEPLVEGDDPENGPGAPMLAIEAGVEFLDLCPAALRPALRRQLSRAFPHRQSAGPEAVQRLATRAFNPAGLIKMEPARAEQIFRDAGANSNMIVELEKKRQGWITRLAKRFARAPSGGSGWNKERLEYGFSLRASAVGARLTCDSYDGSRFDWYQARISSPGDQAFKPVGGAELSTPLLTRARYAGMPARRFWNFEEGDVFFGNLAADPTDLPHLILAEFATVYSDDWYVAPVTMSAGTLGKITSVHVVDVFGGEPRPVPPAAAVDGPQRPWRFFELTGDRSADRPIAQATSPWLYIPRVLDAPLSGPELERVTILRDEAANLAWAIEHKIEGPDGRAIDRVAAWRRAAEALETVESAPDGELKGMWRYIIESAPPPFWVPFAPLVENNRTTGKLVRQRMQAWSHLPAEMKAITGPQAMTTAPEGPLEIHDEEIPREGLVLTRAYQAARSSSGRLLLWAARRKAPAGIVPTSERQVDMAADESGIPIDNGMAQRGDSQ